MKVSLARLTTVFATAAAVDALCVVKDNRGIDCFDDAFCQANDGCNPANEWGANGWCEYETTMPPTTMPPTTMPPTTSAPTTMPPTTMAPTTMPPTTMAPTTMPPTTMAPTTMPPTTMAPTTMPPTAAPTDATQPPVDSSEKYRGIYDWTWAYRGAVSPPNPNIWILFGGYADARTAIREAEEQRKWGDAPPAGVDQWLNIGGGNGQGKFTAARLAQLNQDMSDGYIKSFGYVGICYDVEEGEPGLAGAFKESFAIAKANGFKTMMSTSHSRPYGFEDAVELMDSFFEDTNIDIITPQLYTAGREDWNDYDWLDVPWESWRKAKMDVVVSITEHFNYPDAVRFFGELGIPLAGWIQWKQSVTSHPPVPGTTAKPTVGTDPTAAPTTRAPTAPTPTAAPTTKAPTAPTPTAAPTTEAPTSPPVVGGKCIAVDTRVSDAWCVAVRGCDEGSNFKGTFCDNA